MTEQSAWIDFKQLRLSLNFERVLEHYGAKLTIKGDRASGFCPLPTHEGKRKSPSFSVQLQRGIWQCFGCKAKGNVLDFACRMEGLDPEHPGEFRKAALRIREIFQTAVAAKARAADMEKRSQKVLVNAPIDFELKNLDPDHPYLKERGFTDETIHFFGLGFCNRGMLKGRVAIPIQDPKGQLVGYAGRLTKDEEIRKENPKYLFPGTRVKDDVILEFRSSLLLYNCHGIKEPMDHLFVVEGFPATWWLWQADYRNVVALMGSSCSDEQGKLIIDLVKPDGKVWHLPDGNDAGRRCALSLLERVSPHRFVRWIRLTDEEQPTDLMPDELMAVFGQ